jgi:8-oxo-dGTP pyrophosphatase MutT (NUDIX family)
MITRILPTTTTTSRKNVVTAMTMAKRVLSQQVNNNINSLEKCPTLVSALPRLRTLLTKLSHANAGIFPLFRPSATKRIWQTMELGQSSSNEHRRQAAILVPLVSLQGVPSLLFTVRSSHLSTHAAEVSFPGGHFDDGGGDVTLEDTAIREAKEELLGHATYPWHLPDSVELLGRATTLPSITGTPVTPILAVLPYIISAETFPGNPDEVEEIFTVSLVDLVHMETMEASERFQSDIPVYPVGPGQKIWGLTAVVTRPILHKLLKPIFL